jgi:hypothetical protein
MRLVVHKSPRCAFGVCKWTNVLHCTFNILLTAKLRPVPGAPTGAAGSTGTKPTPVPPASGFGTA